MTQVIAVGLGGCVGALLRYGLVGWIPQWPLSQTMPIPIGVLIVNLMGCLLIGVLKGLSDARDFFSPATALLVFTGCLGSFTTFSTFGMETVDMLQAGQWSSAVLYVGISVLVGLILVWVGYNISVLLA
jgi:CrcB protein